MVDDEGRVIYFSSARFVRDICRGGCCFICGADPSQKEFDEEHVLPSWILRRYELAGRYVTLPNGTRFRYDQYKVPCCIACNRLMADTFETPISRLLDEGSDAVYKYIEKKGTMLFFLWLALIFFKTHLKDRSLRLNRDLRDPDDAIANLYSWEDLHHIHTVARSFYTGAELARESIGSLWLLAVRTEASDELFDFADLYTAQTLLLRLGDIAFLCVFNDSCGAMNFIEGKAERITGAVSELQLRELMAELAFVNVHLKERPVYRYRFDPTNEHHRIEAELPTLALKALDKTIRGDLMYHALKHAIGKINVPGITKEQFEASLKAGDWTFLFDNDGKFIASNSG